MDSIQFAPSRATRIGQQFGSYLIERLLGCGAFATVFLGRHQYLDTNAAIKILHRQFADSERRLFSNEARTAARLVHPRIVRVLE
jgi:serine/threonine protein kinase